MSKKKKEERKRFWDKYKVFYDKIPLNCKLCKEFLEDSDFIKDNKVPYGCGETDSAKADFIKDCDEFKLSKWRIVYILRKSFKRIKELERLVNIHETFMKEQYQYDRKLTTSRFEWIEKKIKFYHIDSKNWIKEKKK